MLTDKETLDAINEENERLVIRSIMEKKRDLVCETCEEEFYSNLDAGKHAIEFQHYSFKLKGTNLKLAVL